MTFKHALSFCVLGLLAMAPLDSFADRRFVDFYAGSADETQFIAGLKTMGLYTLRAQADVLEGEIALSCGVSAVLVGASAVAETVPLLGGIPKLLTTRTMSEAEYDADNAPRFSITLGTVAGGALSAVLGTLDVGVMALVDGKLTQPYRSARLAYWGTEGVAADLFARNSGCRKTLDQFADAVSELRSRRRERLNAASQTADVQGTKTVELVERSSPDLARQIAAPPRAAN